MKKNAKLILGLLFTAAAIFLFICVFTTDGVFGSLALPCITVGLPLIFDYFMEKRGSKLTLPILALIFSVSCIPLWLFGELFAYGALRNIDVANLFFIAAVLYPIVGIILGICSLTSEEKSKGRLGLAITAIAFPVLVVLVLILLFSTGALVISLM